MRKNSHLHIAVIGNIASGKATASQILASGLKAELVADIPLLEFDSNSCNLCHPNNQKGFIREVKQKLEEIKRHA